MKTLIVSLLLGTSFSVHAYESIGYRIYRQSYDSQKGYAYENRCFRYEYREQYFTGNARSPGYVKSFSEICYILNNLIYKIIYVHSLSKYLNNPPLYVFYSLILEFCLNLIVWANV